MRLGSHEPSMTRVESREEKLASAISSGAREKLVVRNKATLSLSLSLARARARFFKKEDSDSIPLIGLTAGRELIF